MNFTLEKENVNAVSGTTTEIVDEDDGNREVGEVLLERDSKGENRKIQLYGRYEWTCGSHAEAVAFIKGVEAVLNHLID
jgi:hypothetical protein